LLSEFGIWSGDDEVDWKWKKWSTGSIPSRRAGKKDLIVKITFDTAMETSITPAIQLNVRNRQYSFLPWTEGVNIHGWWTSSFGGGFWQNKTWKGRILAKDLPDVTNAVATISIRAAAADGSYNDTTNELSQYASNMPMSYIKIMLDTKKDKGNAKGK
jgi:hypothetical protein